MEKGKLAKAISDFSLLPLFVINRSDNSMRVISTGSLQEEVLEVFNPKFFVSLVQKNTDKCLYKYVHSTSLTFLVFNLSDGTSLIYGPYYSGKRESDPLINAIERQLGSKLSTQRKARITDSIRVKDSLFADAWKTIICGLSDIPDTELIEVREDSTTENESVSIPGTDKNRLMESVITSGYGFEHRLRQAIIEADKDKLYELLLPNKDISSLSAELGQNIMHRFENKKTNSIKNAQIILNTIFRISAENAGLPPIYLHSVSDEIAREIDKASDTDSFFRVLNLMINSYCDAIKRVNIGSKSYRITRVQKYIISNLNSELKLEDLADVADTSPQHLSRLFRKECGTTITQYIRTQRINEAKWLLQTTDSPIVEISESLGFSSQNYFCNVFRKETGLTPSEYKAKSEITRN